MITHPRLLKTHLFLRCVCEPITVERKPASLLSGTSAESSVFIIANSFANFQKSMQVRARAPQMNTIWFQGDFTTGVGDTADTLPYNQTITDTMLPTTDGFSVQENHART